MSRLLSKILVPTAALVTFAVGSTIAWSNNASIKGDRAVVSQNPTTLAAPAAPDFDAAFAGRTRKADRESAPRAEVKVDAAVDAAVKVDFSQIFADASATPRRNNTPANREKLRNTGWARMDEPR
jgi:hypothetical protein